MKLKKAVIKKSILLIVTLVFSIACAKEEAPSGRADFTIDLYSSDGAALQTIGGYQYYNGGYNGVLVIRYTADSFIAFERACPKNNECQVEVGSSVLLLTCPCCKTEFIAMDGTPITGGATGTMLRQYSTRFWNSRYVSVSNF